MSIYKQLERMTIVVADTGDLRSIEKFLPRDATTNPSLITAAAQIPLYQEVVDSALRLSLDEVNGDSKQVVARAIDRLSVEFGRRILKIITGRVSTEVDARLSYDTEATVAKARQLIGFYQEAGIPKERVLIKIAATWEGIRAAEKLQKEGIFCNLTLIFGLHQAAACAEAKVTLVSPFVGRILDWHLKQTGRQSYPAIEDPGVLSVRQIYLYYKCHGYTTEVMAASFRNLGEIIELAGCDLMTISPKLLNELHSTEGRLVKKLDKDYARTLQIDKVPVDQTSFESMHQADRMASEKLDEGIKGFVAAIEALEALLEHRLSSLNDISSESLSHAIGVPAHILKSGNKE